MSGGDDQHNWHASDHDDNTRVEVVVEGSDSDVGTCEEEAEDVHRADLKIGSREHK